MNKTKIHMYTKINYGHIAYKNNDILDLLSTYNSKCRVDKDKDMNDFKCIMIKVKNTQNSTPI